MGKSSGGGDTTQTTEPWSGQKPFLTDLFRQAQGMFNQGIGQQYYPGQTVAPFSPAQQMGMGMLEQSAMGTPQQAAMGNYIGGAMMNPGTLAGVGMDMPGANPYLDAMYNRAAGRAGEQFAEQTLPGIAAQFGGMGRTGGGIHQQVLQNAAEDFGRGLQDMGAQMYGGAYETGMGRDIQRRELAQRTAQQAAQMAPAFQAMNQQNIQNMLAAGQMTQDQAQRLMDADRQRFEFERDAPLRSLQQYGNIVYGLPGGFGQTTSSGPGQGPNWAGGLGGAATGAGLGQALGATALGPWAALGGIAGLL